VGLSRPVRPHLHPAAALLVVALLALGLAAAASAAPLRGATVGASLRVGRAPVIPAGATAQGALSESSVIDAIVALEPRDPAALTAYAQFVSEKGSRLYHHYLSVPQFASRFAPGSVQVASVRAALRAEGLKVGRLAANGLSLDVSASAGRMSSAFATSFRRYRTRNGHIVFANTAAPSLPASVAGLVQSVVGLDSVAVPTPAGLVTSHSRHAPRVTSKSVSAPGEVQCGGAAGTGGNTAGQIASAYGLSDLYATGNGGNGSTVALFELESYSASDVATYQSCYGASASVSNVLVAGGPGSGSGSGEAALDIEDVIGLVPDASILVYEGKNTGTGALQTYQAIVTDDRAKVVSTSWGLCEADEGSLAANVENTLFQEAAVQGQTVLAASGDHGAQDCASGTESTKASVDDPASQPYVTGVGGTSLSAIGPPPTESVWNGTWNSGTGSASGAGGGGVSTVWGQPSYQSGIALTQLATSCGKSRTTCREVPDVSADADINTGYSIYYKGHWSIFGGTSAAAPTWAALAALANASAACAGKSVGFANPALYHAAASAYSTFFNDVISGNNSYHGITGFGARSGYDMASGLGSPKGAAVAAIMCGSTWTPPATSTTPTTSPAPTPAPTVTLTRPAVQTANVSQSVWVQLHATDSAGHALSFTAAGLPAGLSVRRSTGLITGTPKRAGKKVARIVVTDTAGATAQNTVSFNVAGKPTISGGLSLKRGRPLLSLKVRAGTNAPPIRSIVVVPPGAVHFARRAADLSRGITVLDGSGHRLKSIAKLRGGSLVVTLRTGAVRTASLHITVPAISLIKTKAGTDKRRHPAVLQTLTVVVTDASAYRTAISLR
jgi:subtilase family serine protease